MKFRFLLGCVVLTILALAGCRGYRPWFGFPGTIQQQRLRATIHDPYADNDLGPEVVGARPRDFQKPAPEPVRSRSLSEHWWSR